MVYVDPLKLEAHQLSVMDVVRTINQANLILPAGDVKIGPYDYNIYANNQINAMKDIDMVPLKTVGRGIGAGGGRGQGEGCFADPVQQGPHRRPALGVRPGAEAGRRGQYHRGGQRRQAGGEEPLYVPKRLVTKVVFDQSVFVRTAIDTLVHEGAIGLVLTGLDDPGLPGQHARHGGGVSVHSRSRRWRPSSRWAWAAARSTR